MSENLRARRNGIAGLALAGAVVLAAGVLPGGLLAKGTSSGDQRAKPDQRRLARAALVNAAGEAVGAVRFERRGKSRALRVSVSLRKLSPGFHGFHVHAAGRCDAPSFAGAGPHLNPRGAAHPEHAGDMPPLLVTSGGTSQARFVTDRLSLADLRDSDGSAVIVHALPDNQANIPEDRYDPDPDETTLGTGDSGARIACGVVR